MLRTSFQSVRTGSEGQAQQLRPPGGKDPAGGHVTNIEYVLAERQTGRKLSPGSKVSEPDLHVTLLREKAENFIEGFHGFQDRINDRLRRLVRNDRFLEYLFPKPSSANLTEQQVKDALALHHGQAIRLLLQRADGVQLPIVVRSDGRVGDIYKAVVNVTNEYIEQLRSSRLSKQTPVNSKCHHKKKKRKKSHKRRLEESPRVNSIVSAFAHPPPMETKKLNWKRFWRIRALEAVLANSTHLLTDKKRPIKDQENLKNGSILRFVQRR
ncbi:U11/U12 small nuclear ribonucleoprotein [Sparganum proliferum]